jgi:pyruvate/2-oxoacid:ferredoxin oxidoreductase beta subunit/NAD-dependent dihydropyrimidine dehydrogenase PreA subunit
MRELTVLDEVRDLILPAYGAVNGDDALLADEAFARSAMPAGTASARDMRRLAPTLPVIDPERCVGCMACVSACPDSALVAMAQPEPLVREAELARGARAPDGVVDAHFARTQKYAEVPARKGLTPALFGLFVDPETCKGCGECVEVCANLGHDAIRLVDKDEPSAERPSQSVLDAALADVDWARTLPPTPPEYRNEKALADLMLGEHANGFVGGAGACAGCGESTALRMLLAATRQVHGPDAMGIVAATGCNTVAGSTFPYNPYLVSWTNSLFENAPAVALGIRTRWEQAGQGDRRLWVVGGDGAMYDIGFQALSRMVASGKDIKVLVLDTQVYSNTGGQASTASFGGQVTKLSAYGAALHGRPERRKELGRIMLAHGDVFVAQTTPAHLNHFYRSILDANAFPGPAVVVVYAACMPEHGIADDAGMRQARLAVDSRAFPLFTYDPRRGETIAERLSLQGNPSTKADWHVAPDGTPVDFLAFARTEGRFAPHFDKDGTPTPEIEATQADRLANWRTLQELAGIR